MASAEISMPPPAATQEVPATASVAADTTPAVTTTTTPIEQPPVTGSGAVLPPPATATDAAFASAASTSSAPAAASSSQPSSDPSNATAPLAQQAQQQQNQNPNPNPYWMNGFPNGAPTGFPPQQFNPYAQQQMFPGGFVPYGAAPFHHPNGAPFASMPTTAPGTMMSAAAVAGSSGGTAAAGAASSTTPQSAAQDPEFLRPIPGPPKPKVALNPNAEVFTPGVSFGVPAGAVSVSSAPINTWGGPFPNAPVVDAYSSFNAHASQQGFTLQPDVPNQPQPNSEVPPVQPILNPDLFPTHFPPPSHPDFPLFVQQHQAAVQQLQNLAASQFNNGAAAAAFLTGVNQQQQQPPPSHAHHQSNNFSSHRNNFNPRNKFNNNNGGFSSNGDSPHRGHGKSRGKRHHKGGQHGRRQHNNNHRHNHNNHNNAGSRNNHSHNGGAHNNNHHNNSGAQNTFHILQKAAPPNFGSNTPQNAPAPNLNNSNNDAAATPAPAASTLPQQQSATTPAVPAQIEAGEAVLKQPLASSDAASDPDASMTPQNAQGDATSSTASATPTVDLAVADDDQKAAEKAAKDKVEKKSSEKSPEKAAPKQKAQKGKKKKTSATPQNKQPGKLTKAQKRRNRKKTLDTSPSASSTASPATPGESAQPTPATAPVPRRQPLQQEATGVAAAGKSTTAAVEKQQEPLEQKASVDEKARAKAGIFPIPSAAASSASPRSSVDMTSVNAAAPTNGPSSVPAKPSAVEQPASKAGASAANQSASKPPPPQPEANAASKPSPPVKRVQPANFAAAVAAGLSASPARPANSLLGNSRPAIQPRVVITPDDDTPPESSPRSGANGRDYQQQDRRQRPRGYSRGGRSRELDEPIDPNAPRHEGVCCWYDPQKFGFLWSKDFDRDVFVHPGSVIGDMTSNSRVSFVIGEANGKMCGRDVRVLPGGAATDEEIEMMNKRSMARRGHAGGGQGNYGGGNRQRGRTGSGAAAGARNNDTASSDKRPAGGNPRRRNDSTAGTAAVRANGVAPLNKGKAAVASKPKPAVAAKVVSKPKPIPLKAAGKPLGVSAAKKPATSWAQMAKSVAMGAK